VSGKVLTHQTQAISDLDKQRLAEIVNQEKNLEPLQKDTPEELALKAQLAELSERDKAKTREREGEFSGVSGSGIKGYGSHALQISRELEAIDKETKAISEKLRIATEKRGQEIAVARTNQQSAQNNLKHLIEVLRERQSYLQSILTEDAKKEELARLNRERANSATNGTSGTTEAESVKSIQTKIEALAGIKLKDAKKASLLDRLTELSKLRDKEDVALTCIVIWCVFILFETMPIAAKFFFKYSRYDFFLLAEKEKAFIDHQQEHINAVEALKREQDQQTTQTIEQQQLNDQFLTQNATGIFFDAYMTNTRAAIDEFTQKNRRGPDNVKDIEESFTKYFLISKMLQPNPVLRERTAYTKGHII
jgi:hypothetical protein